MGCKDAVLPKHLLKHCRINSLTYEENRGHPYKENLCLFGDFVLHLHGNQRLEEETSKIFNFFSNKMDKLSPNQLKGVHLNNIPFVEDLLTLNILLSCIDIVDRTTVGELARRSVQKYENTAHFLRANNYICCVSNINSVFQSIRCPNCQTFSKKHSKWIDI